MPIVKLDRKEVADVFVQATHQHQALERIYQMALGIEDLDKVEVIHGWPSCNERTWKDIARMFQDFDKIHHKDCMPGGGWLNRGFSVGDGLEAWEVNTDDVTIEWKKPEGGQDA